MFSNFCMFFEYPALFSFAAVFIAVAIVERMTNKRYTVILSAIYIGTIFGAFFTLMALRASLADVSIMLMIALLPRLIFTRRKHGDGQ